MQNLTASEKEMLVSYAYCEYNSTNGDPDRAVVKEDFATYVFLDEHIPTGMNLKQAKGVLGSLVKKGLVKITYDPDGDYIDFTTKGFNTTMKLTEKELFVD